MKFIKLHKIDNPGKDKEIFVNVERINFIETKGSAEFPITTLFLSPGLVEVRESAEEVRSLIGGRNNYNY